MSENPASKNRTRLLVAVAVLLGAIILLVVTELASVKDKPGSESTQQSG